MKILTEEEILKFAQKLAYSQNISSKKNKNDKSIRMLNDDFSYISSIYKKINEKYKSRKITVPASEWLMDNFYIIEEHAKQISGFIDVINGADVEYVTAQEGRRAVDTIERIYKDK